MYDFNFTFDIVKKNKVEYVNIPMSFDIEVSSFYEVKGTTYNNEDFSKLSNETKKHGIKKAIMYIWTVAINDKIYQGRTYKDFLIFLSELTDYLGLSTKRKVIIYVHNLAYEFQFIHKWLNIIDVFTVDSRKVLKFETECFIFKCSYLLSGYSLDRLAKNYNLNVKKLVGDLDYNLIRHSETELTPIELEYTYNDVLIITEYIKIMIQEYGDITKIPLTQTGKVRTIVRKNIFKNKELKKLIQYKLRFNNAKEFNLVKSAFMGGFTHANSNHVNKILHNVHSYDFTSSYPATLCSEKYPISKGVRINANKLTLTELKQYLYKYCCVFCITIYNLKQKKGVFENILSESKCVLLDNNEVKKVNAVVNNGRIYSCKKLTTFLTEIDFFNILKFYDFDEYIFHDFYIYKKDYLPKEFIMSVLEFYKEKTELKGVKGKEIEYLHYKELLNSCYGMCVTNTIKINDEYDYNNKEWKNTNKVIKNFSHNPYIINKVSEYNTDKQRFLFFLWGVYCTAYARNNLYSGILELGNDYIYSDTDSVKFMNLGKHQKYFDDYNKRITNKLNVMCSKYNIPINYIKPKTIKGIEKPLGVWDYEGCYDSFKTLGAKRYLTKYNDEYNITVAGLPKKTIKYLFELAEQKNKDIFDIFDNNLYIPSEKSNKNVLTYIDNEIQGTVIDYKGKPLDYYEKSAIHIDKTDFSMNVSINYIEFLLKYVKEITNSGVNL